MLNYQRVTGLTGFPALGFAARFRKICKNKTLWLLGIPPKRILKFESLTGPSKHLVFQILRSDLVFPPLWHYFAKALFRDCRGLGGSKAFETKPCGQSLRMSS